MTRPDHTSKRTRQKIWIVLPAYNEEASLPHLLERIEDSMFETDIDHQIVLVDDGSTDRTLKIAEQAALNQPLIIERHQINLGLGATIRDGLLKACELSHPRDPSKSVSGPDDGFVWARHDPALYARSRYKLGSTAFAIAERSSPICKNSATRSAQRFRIQFP